MESTLKRKILDILSDYRWHSMAEMAFKCANGNTIATSISQRIGDLKKRGIQFDQRHFGSNHWEWRLITPLDQIDFESCILKPQEPVAISSLPHKTSKLPVPTSIEQMEIAL